MSLLTLWPQNAPSPLFVLMHGWPLMEKTFSHFNSISSSPFKWPAGPYENAAFVPSKGHFSVCPNLELWRAARVSHFRVVREGQMSCGMCVVSHSSGGNTSSSVLFSRCHRRTFIRIRLTPHRGCEPKSDSRRMRFKNASHPRKKT